ncbi:hypothetical protein ACFPFV_08120 [Salinicoccus siamensis]|uniref:hypothetical protein n=1 Tax=Salinicoccus siamensis TaxID=381830 RepID=UPI003617BD71
MHCGLQTHHHPRPAREDGAWLQPGVERYKLEHISHLREHRHYLRRNQSGERALSVYFNSAAHSSWSFREKYSSD